MNRCNDFGSKDETAFCVKNARNMRHGHAWEVPENTLKSDINNHSKCSDSWSFYAYHRNIEIFHIQDVYRAAVDFIKYEAVLPKKKWGRKEMILNKSKENSSGVNRMTNNRWINMNPRMET